MISTSYANFDEFKAASRQIYLPMLRVDKFAFRYVNELKQVQGDHPLLQAVLHASIPEARIPALDGVAKFSAHTVGQAPAGLSAFLPPTD
ncbi:hypothetical protein [Undibacterium sp.]|uniref:hypothetical protein n=1 Tax=Undibacterium sp. TaxID=1914977 RepID=UPI0027311C4F|nr:hypothetical protein [Undibacterium sp.]MDP1980397.1 hypothetical protein [Undibacterium sp.]